MKNGRLFPLLLAFLLATLSLGYRFMLGLPCPENDDYQMYFMLCNGGSKEASIFAIYTHVGLGAIVKLLTLINPAINWYLTSLLLIAFSSCVILNYLVAKAILASETTSPAYRIKLLVSILLLFHINVVCLHCLQYTHVAVYCCCVGALVLGQPLLKAAGHTKLRILAGIAMLLTGYMIRTSAIFPAFILLGGMYLARIITSRNILPCKQICYICSSLLAMIALLIGIQKMAYINTPEWDDAASFLHSRVSILDYFDNSGIDKSEQYRKVGIEPQEMEILKSFTYVPSMDSLEKIQAAEIVHRQDRKGLWGIDAAGYAGILETRPGQFLAPFNQFRKLTPYTPLGCMCVLFLVMFNKESAKKILPVLLATGGYVILLILVGRCVSRVLDPPLYIAAAWVMMALPDSAPLLRSRLLRWTLSIFCIWCALVCMRHHRPHFGTRTKTQQPWEYCASRPETLFLTACQQGCGLFPDGLNGYTYQYLKTTNIFPIADGWIFYTPAYRAALKARGMANPYLKLTEPNTQLATFNRWGHEEIQERISQLHEMATGTKLSFRLVGRCGEFDFWQASAEDKK